MDEYIVKDGKSLRLGYTTGSCAAAASKAAAWMLLTGQEKRRISLATPKGIVLDLDILDIKRSRDFVSCAIEKDSGDDPDVTKGTLIYARVSRSEVPGISIDGGTGVGRVSKPGLDRSVGEAAINSVPRRMIRENLEEVMALCDYSGGLKVEIYAPDGEALAKKTFNPRLGIVGGISILGTTGIVEPMSEKALVDTIRIELRQRRENGADCALLTPGNYGSDFIRGSLGIEPQRAVQISNFVGASLDMCREIGFNAALLVGHVGKLVKLAGGMMDTHSKYGDCRMEIIAAHAGANGADRETVKAVLGCVACDEAVRILKEREIAGPVLADISTAITAQLSRRGGDMETGMLFFSKEHGILGQSENCPELISKIMGG